MAPGIGVLWLIAEVGWILVDRRFKPTEHQSVPADLTAAVLEVLLDAKARAPIPEPDEKPMRDSTTG